LRTFRRLLPPVPRHNLETKLLGVQAGTGAYSAKLKVQKKHLDAIEPSRPVIIGDSDGYTLWLN
jgi:predicted amidohydrolase YtcJ